MSLAVTRSVQPGGHLRWLRRHVPQERLFAPRVVVVLRDSAGCFLVDRAGRLPAAELELESSITATAAALLASSGLPASFPLRPIAVHSGPDWWEEHPDLGPLQPLWLVVGAQVEGRLPAAVHRLEVHDLALLSAQDDRLSPAPGRAGGDYIRAVRSRIGSARIFYPWAGVAVRDDRERLLLVRLRSGAQWHCPGGGMEIGETPGVTARREVREETGLEIRVGDLVGVFSAFLREFPNGDRIQGLAILQHGRTTGGSMISDPTGEIDEAGFFGADELPPLTRPWDARIRLVLTGNGPRVD